MQAGDPRCLSLSAAFDFVSQPFRSLLRNHVLDEEIHRP